MPEIIERAAVFSGRASRQAYWMFFLFALLTSFVIGFATGVVQAITHADLMFIPNLYALALLIPSISIGVRRMHDSDRSGWWLIVPFVGLVFLFVAGTPGANRFGPESGG
nr:DUF805 domain-containing protein [uncultured Aquabacterium sp.]